MNVGYITELKNVRKHPNADRLLLGDCFGNTVCVSTDYKEGQLGIYFQSGLQLSENFCNVNNLVRRKDENGNDVGGYLDPIKRNITTIKLRGEKSDGLFLPLNSLDYCFNDNCAENHLKIGDTIDIVNGNLICEKYIPKKANRTSAGRAGTRARRLAKRSIAPTFFEHADTEQLAYNLNAFKPGDLVEITLKMHGTSQRTGYLKVFKGMKRTFWDKIFHREGTPIYDWGYISGTRRTILNDFEGGFYGSNAFREIHAKQLEGKLHKGETVYYEVVSFTDTGTPIMGIGNVPKEEQKNYGKTMIFHYGLDEGSDMYVYRMTMTNEDGEVVEYTPDFMRYRCEQMGVKTVPVFWKGYIPAEGSKIINMETNEEYVETAGEFIKRIAENYYDGPDPIGKTHVREGIVVRIINRPKFTAYKHKNFLFKQISGIISNNVSETSIDISDDILAEL